MVGVCDMMGRTHALTGWCGGLAVAPIVGADDFASTLVFAAVTTGAALLPDFDHPNARASRLLGPITRVVCAALRAVSRGAYRRTASGQDTNRKDPHRTLTHTFLFAFVLGGLVAALTALTGAVGVAVTAGLMVALAVDALGVWVLLAVVPGVVAAVVDPDSLNQLPVTLGAAVAVGCGVHILGDWVTEAPVPMLWPVPIRGRRWFPCNAPAFLRFRVDGPVEHLVVFPVFSVLAVLLVPGVLGTMVDVVEAVLSV